MAGIEKINVPVPLSAPADDAEDRGMSGAIALPGYDVVNEQKVLRSVKETFKSFDADAFSGGVKFDSPEAIANYMQVTMDDICKVRQSAEASQLCQKAASMARFWYLGKTIDDALMNKDYGTNAVSKIAAALRKSVPYIYQIRTVATRLSVVDCYLLGVRGLDSSHLRKLSQVKDDNVRRSVIDAFISVVRDTSSSAALEVAKRQLLAAVSASQGMDPGALATSDPFNGGTDMVVSPEYNEASKTVQALAKTVRKLASDKEVSAACDALNNFYLSSDVPDAPKHLEELQIAAGEIACLCRTAVENLKDIADALESLKAVELTPSEQ